jgi:hypothetical protein
MKTRLLLALLCIAGARGIVLDRIAVTVGKDVITETEVDQAIRITALINGDAPVYNAKSRREAAGRLVDQDLIRRDMELSKWPQPEPEAVTKLLEQVKRERLGGDAGYRQALQRSGTTEAELFEYLRWQLATLRYTESRFRPGAPAPGIVQPHTNGVDGVAPAAGADGAAAATGTDAQLDAWLKDARTRVTIVYHEETFR